MDNKLSLELKHISKTFPGVKALNDVSFSAQPGKVCGIVGVNGAGKSTLMNILGEGLRRSGRPRLTGFYWVWAPDRCRASWALKFRCA